MADEGVRHNSRRGRRRYKVVFGCGFGFVVKFFFVVVALVVFLFVLLLIEGVVWAFWVVAGEVVGGFEVLGGEEMSKRSSSPGSKSQLGRLMAAVWRA